MKSKQNNFGGSILISICVLWLMYLSVFLLMYSEYQEQQLITSEMKKHYQFLLLENLASNYIEENKKMQGVIVYNIGQVSFTKNDKQQQLVITLKSGEIKAVKKTAD